MRISLYRKYRPQTFSDVVGQRAAVGVLLESLRKNVIGHAYLFSGPRGCGKTTAARLVAKALNCTNRHENGEPCDECEACRAIVAGEYLDVMEIDGASNNGVESIRDLKSHVSLKALAGRYKVYIIDEVHMLSIGAFNALLKTLEEPPENVVFLLATTEPHKVPVTIRSRCQHIPFHRITIEDTVERLKFICAKENITADDEALWELARQSDGALRDALSLAEQAIALGGGSLTLDSVRDLTGGSNRAELEQLVCAMRTTPEDAAVKLHAIMSSGISSEKMNEALFIIFRDLWMYNIWQEKTASALEMSSAEKAFLAKEAILWKKDKLEAICGYLARLLPRTHSGMNSEIFSGLVFMEIQNILSGQARGYENKQTAPASTVNYRAVHNTPAPAPVHTPIPAEPQRTVPADVITDVKDLAQNYNDICSHLKAHKTEIAAALLYAALTIDNGQVELVFESDNLAKKVMSKPGLKEILESAAASVWQPEKNKTSETKEIIETKEAKEPAADKPVKEKEPESNAEIGNSLINDIIRKTGAEVLYTKSLENEEEEAEENE